MALTPDRPFTLLSTGTNATGATHGPFAGPYQSFQAAVVGTGTVTATVAISGSNDGTYWVTIGTITLSGTTSASDGFTTTGGWFYYRAVSTNVTGTGAALTVTKGV